jgi:hypothetical protein
MITPRYLNDHPGTVPCLHLTSPNSRAGDGVCLLNRRVSYVITMFHYFTFSFFRCPETMDNWEMSYSNISISTRVHIDVNFRVRHAVDSRYGSKRASGRSTGSAASDCKASAFGVPEKDIKLVQNIIRRSEAEGGG